MRLMRTTPRTTIFVGDQLFTDVWGAKRSGIFSYLTKPIHRCFEYYKENLEDKIIFRILIIPMLILVFLRGYPIVALIVFAFVLLVWIIFAASRSKN